MKFWIIKGYEKILPKFKIKENLTREWRRHILIQTYTVERPFTILFSKTRSTNYPLESEYSAHFLFSTNSFKVCITSFTCYAAVSISTFNKYRFLKPLLTFHFLRTLFRNPRLPLYGKVYSNFSYE